MKELEAFNDLEEAIPLTSFSTRDNQGDENTKMANHTISIVTTEPRSNDPGPADISKYTNTRKDGMSDWLCCCCMEFWGMAFYEK